MWLPIWPIKRTENERFGVGKPSGRLGPTEGPGSGFRSNFMSDNLNLPVSGFFLSRLGGKLNGTGVGLLAGARAEAPGSPAVARTSTLGRVSPGAIGNSGASS